MWEWLDTNPEAWGLLVFPIIFGPVFIGSWISIMRRKVLVKNLHRMTKGEYEAYNKKRSDR